MRSQEHRSLVLFAGYGSVDRRWKQMCGARVSLMGLLSFATHGERG